ncbi:CBS domain-containing protein [Streptomyces broussonetiae]|uniref:CBS domain-containing protein n=1 Tax=Streptomyces broussonetiae TaxID=2686304 RepID=A0A6I6NFH7_9ACTN|nr:CBS domain-containing protein [Streptomyces broussonetiae]
MTRAVVAVGRKALFKEMAERMEQWHVSALPVLEGDGRVIGVVSEADLLPKEEFRDSAPDRIPQARRLPDLTKAGGVTAEELMSMPAVTVLAAPRRRPPARPARRRVRDRQRDHPVARADRSPYAGPAAVSARGAGDGLAESGACRDACGAAGRARLLAVG